MELREFEYLYTKVLTLNSKKTLLKSKLNRIWIIDNIFYLKDGYNIHSFSFDFFKNQTNHEI